MKSISQSRLIVVALSLCASAVTAEDKEPKNGPPEVLTFGEMHMAIGQQQHQGRVVLRELVERDHFYGVGALAGLNGEVTILDSQVVISSVATGKPKPVSVDVDRPQATLLAGAYVSEWSEHKVPKSVLPSEFDEWIRQMAERAGLDTNRTFVFRIDGEFKDVRLHIINGACPVHARIHKTELPPERHPYEAEPERIQGAVVGIYATNSVGKLTHPATSTHAHLIFRDAERGVELTGHLEKMGIVKDAVLKLPKQ